jgi:alkylation response protein AidB-like acyl-CoA dehydrogenase
VLAVTAVGSDGDRARLLPALADGSRVAALALEPPLPSAAAAGDGWAVTGALDAVADAGSCDTLLVRARVDGGEALFELDRRGAAVTCTPVISVDGTRKAAAVTLAGAPATRLGGAGDAAAALDAVIDRVVAALVVDGVGAAEAALAIAVEYAAQREQFGRPIGSFQAVQHLCADMLHDVELARAGAYYAVWACDQLPADAHRAVTMAKAFAGDALAAVGASTIQVLGGVGFTWEHDAHLFYKRLLTLQQAYGSSREHLEALASLVLDG